MPVTYQQVFWLKQAIVILFVCIFTDWLQSTSVKPQQASHSDFIGLPFFLPCSFWQKLFLWTNFRLIGRVRAFWYTWFLFRWYYRHRLCGIWTSIVHGLGLLSSDDWHRHGRIFILCHSLYLIVQFWFILLFFPFTFIFASTFLNQDHDLKVEYWSQVEQQEQYDGWVEHFLGVCLHQAKDCVDRQAIDDFCFVSIIGLYYGNKDHMS